MATPMTLPDVCCLCYGPHGGGTFDLDDDGESVALALSNICAQCRIAETGVLIRRRAGWARTCNGAWVAPEGEE